jgi:hypothetical protein
MPLTGTLDVRPAESELPVVVASGEEPWQLERVAQLQLLYEIDDAAMLSLIPPALHPTIPPTVFVNVLRAPDSPVGPFTLAQVRIGCRSAARPRAFLRRAYCDSQPAIDVLRKRWGYGAMVGDVRLEKRHYEVVAEVDVDGRRILEGRMLSPEAISGGDVQYISNVNLARVDRDGATLTRLVQVDPDFIFHSAERGQPVIDSLDADAWQIPGARPVFPISASYAVADIQMPHLRYLVDPQKGPMEAVERV